jgi:hypothetical protein
MYTVYTVYATFNLIPILGTSVKLTYFTVSPKKCHIRGEASTVKQSCDIMEADGAYHTP